MLQSVKINTSNNEFSLCWSIITVYFTNPGETETIVTNFKQQVVRGVGMPIKCGGGGVLIFFKVSFLSFRSVKTDILAPLSITG